MSANIDPLARRPARATQRWALRLSLVAADTLALALAFALAFWVRFNLDLPLLRTEVIGNPDFYRQAVVFIIPLWLVLFALVGLYRETNLLGGTREYALVFNAVTIGVVVVVVITFFTQEFVLARAWLVMAWAFSILLVDLARFGLRRVVYCTALPRLVPGAHPHRRRQRGSRHAGRAARPLAHLRPAGAGAGDAPR